MRVVDDPDALSILTPVSRQLGWGPNVPVSFETVDIEKLIVTQAVAGPREAGQLLAANDFGSLSAFSLFGPQPALKADAREPLSLISPVPISLSPQSLEAQNSQLIVRYNISKTVRPILVGYEAGRMYLLSELGRVVHALEYGLDRLLCVVYYGLDLNSPSFGVRIVDAAARLNHFGEARLGGEVPPLLSDFLDPRLSVVVPARERLFVTQITAQTSEMEFGIPPTTNVPLDSTGIEIP